MSPERVKELKFNIASKQIKNQAKIDLKIDFTRKNLNIKKNLKTLDESIQENISNNTK